mgnify:CR=1 FL=1
MDSYAGMTVKLIFPELVIWELTYQVKRYNLGIKFTL